MKMLIRSITLGVVGMFMVIVILHCTTVEVIKYELDAAASNSIYHTVNTFEKNRKLVEDGETESLYFTTDSEYYYFFYDDLAVQLNGNIGLDVVCNHVDVDSGDLDVDATVHYKGLDNVEREYTVHADTYGRISESKNSAAWKEAIAQKVSLLSVGTKIYWANKEWVVVNTEDCLSIMLNETTENGSYGSTISYSGSYAKVSAGNFLASLSAEYQNLITEKEIGDFNTLSGIYMENGSDRSSETSYIVSADEAIQLMNAGYEGEYWTRTAGSSTEVKAMTLSGIVNADTGDSYDIRPVISLNISKLTDISSYPEEDGSTSYVIE